MTCGMEGWFWNCVDFFEEESLLDGMVNFFGGGGYVGWFFIFIFGV